MEEIHPWITFNGFSAHVIVLCVVTFLLLCISALVSGAETSFFSLSHNDIRRLKDRRSMSAEAMLKLLSDVDLLLATILVVNNLVNICIVILTANIIDSLFTFQRFVFLFKTVLVTFLLLLFGEILPKVLAQTMPLRFASMVARPLLVLRWVFYPLSYVLVRTSSRISEKAAHRSEISLDELADAVDMTQSSSPEEHVMLSGIVNFVNTEVQEIMKPRVDMTALDMTDDYDTVKRTIIESGFSRIPVYEEDADHIRGTLYVKDLLPYINNDPTSSPNTRRSTTCWAISRRTRCTWRSLSTNTARRWALCRSRTSSRRSWGRSPTRAITTNTSIHASMRGVSSSRARHTSGISSASWRSTKGLSGISAARRRPLRV